MINEKSGILSHRLAIYIEQTVVQTVLEKQVSHFHNSSYPDIEMSSFETFTAAAAAEAAETLFEPS